MSMIPGAGVEGPNQEISDNFCVLSAESIQVAQAAPLVGIFADPFKFIFSIQYFLNFSIALRLEIDFVTSHALVSGACFSSSSVLRFWVIDKLI